MECLPPVSRGGVVGGEEDGEMAHTKYVGRATAAAAAAANHAITALTQSYQTSKDRPTDRPTKRPISPPTRPTEPSWDRYHIHK